MSTTLARKAAPAPQRRPQEDRRHLEAVATRSRRRPRTVYALVAVATLLAIVAAQLLLSIAVSDGAFQIERLQDEHTKAERDYQAVSQAVKRLSSPQNLAANAEALGMVTDSTPVYLRLSDGAVLGTPQAATAAEGTVTGGSGRLVPNALLNGTPLVTQPGGPDAAPGADQGAPGTPVPTTPAAPVPLEGPLPAPTTH